MVIIDILKFKVKKYLKKRNSILRQQVRQWLNLNVITETLQFQSDEISYQVKVINELKEVIKERTEYHIDVCQTAKHNSQIILIGKYHKNDFVKCYSISDNEFRDLIRHCRNLEKYACRGKIDAFPTMSAYIKNTIYKENNYDR